MTLAVTFARMRIMPGGDRVDPRRSGVKLTYDDFVLFPDDGKRHELDVVRVYRRSDDHFDRPIERAREAHDVLTTPLLPLLNLPLERTSELKPGSAASVAHDRLPVDHQQSASFQFVSEPRFGKRPVARHRLRRHVQNRGGLLHAEAREKPKFDDAALALVDFLQRFERVVEGDDVRPEVVSRSVASDSDTLTMSPPRFSAPFVRA